MATNFPTSKDALTNPSATDELVGHAAQHSNLNDAIEAIENVIGVTNSTDADSLTYKVNALSASVVGISNTSLVPSFIAILAIPEPYLVIVYVIL